MSEMFYPSLMLLLLCSVTPSVVTAGLNDPMQPPAGYRAVDAAGSNRAADRAGWVLQSIKRGGGRDLAMIDGVLVSLGERYRGARLTKINADGVVLQRRSGRVLVLELTPGVQKQVSAEMEIRSK